MNNKEKYFSELREQIIKEEKWDKDHFIVFNHEASSGKSQSTFRFIAEFCNEKMNRVIYVQKFVRDEELLNTVATINHHAGRKIAEGFHSKMNRKEEKEALKAQVICISHQMYLEICKGNRLELVENRDVLIIDEFVDTVERITLSGRDIGEIWMKAIEVNQLESIAYLLRKKFYDYKNMPNKNKICYIDFKGKEYDSYKNLLFQNTTVLNKKVGDSLLVKLQQILTNGCLYFENAFHTFNNKIKLHLLKNNIILDANGGFDYRYQLSSQFIVKKQEKFFEYTSSTLRHFKIKTDKTALKKQINLAESVFKNISLEDKEKTLIITDKENSDNLRNKVSEYLDSFGYEKLEVESKVKIDYFGNLIGVNLYRDFNTVIVLKTPFYDYLSYVLMYFYLQVMEKKDMEDIIMFENEAVEKIRKTVVGGELYQGIKRINRDNSQSAQIIVCTDYQEAIEVVLEQLPQIQYKKDVLSVAKVKELPENSSPVRIAKVEKYLLEKMEAGVEKVSKKELRELVGISDSSNFNHQVLSNLTPFIERYGIKVINRYLILNTES